MNDDDQSPSGYWMVVFLLMMAVFIYWLIPEPFIYETSFVTISNIIGNTVLIFGALIVFIMIIIRFGYMFNVINANKAITSNIHVKIAQLELDRVKLNNIIFMVDANIKSFDSNHYTQDEMRNMMVDLHEYLKD